MTVGPDENLFVADGAANTVKKYSILDGHSLGDLTLSDNVLNPIDPRFYDTGGLGTKLYVLGGSTQRQVRRYNLAGEFESIRINTTSTVVSAARDFVLMPDTGDWLVAGSNNKVVRFAASNGIFVSNFINSSGSSGVLNDPRCILYGPEGAIWISSKSSPRITRFNPTTGARIDDIVSGSPLSGACEFQFEAGALVVANSLGNNILRYPLTISGDPVTVTPGAGQIMVPANAGLSSPQNLLFVDINDPPVANAGADQTIEIGHAFSLNAGASTDPEGHPLAFTWTQLSGPPVLPAPATGSILNLTAPDAPAPLAFQLTVNDGVRASSDTITVQLTAPPTETWRYRYFSSIYNTGNAADLADPDHDGLVNLLERAFKLNPTLADFRYVIPNTGTSGLPCVTVFQAPGGSNLSLQYVRLKASSNYGLTYTPQLSSALDHQTWTTATGLEIVESIDADWVRVTIESTATAALGRFGRVMVTAQP